MKVKAGSSVPSKVLAREQTGSNSQKLLKIFKNIFLNVA